MDDTNGIIIKNKVKQYIILFLCYLWFIDV